MSNFHNRAETDVNLTGRKTAFIQKASNRLTREQNFLIIDWHCYIIITIVTKK